MTAFDRTTLDLLAARQPAWRAEQMVESFGGFEAQAVPTGVEEEWRYVDLGLDLDRMAPVIEPGAELVAGPFVQTAMSVSGGRIAIVDGTVSDVSDTPAGVNVRRMSDLDQLQPAAAVDRDKFAAGHLAFATDGVRIEVAAGQAIERPILIDIQATQADTISFPHVELSVGANAEAGFIVVFRSPDGVELAAVPGVTLEAGDGGRVRYLAVQSWGDATVGVIHQKLRLGRDSTGRIGEIGLGGRVGRLDLHVELEGAGSSSEVVGLYFGEHEQVLDYRMLIQHLGRNTSSDVYLKGAVADSAQSVFTGLLRIEKDAIRTSAFETNRNLVLSENAKAHSVPNLEILCDDVVCGHGSSVGPLEDEHRYYLQSRGLSKERAERLLIQGFFTDVVDRLPIDVLAEPIQSTVFDRFLTAQKEGRIS